MADLTWDPVLEGRTGPRYRAIADALGADIASGQLAPGTRLPTQRRLAERLGVTVGTITRAYTEAERRGLVDATVGRGTFVRAGVASLETPSASASRVEAVCFPALSPGSRPHVAQARMPAEADDFQAAGPDMTDLSANFPVGSYLAEALDPALEALRGEPSRLNEAAAYQAAVGHAAHREAGAVWLADLGLPTTADSLVLSNGCQGGLSITVNALTHPGDTILVESLAWPGIHTLARQRGLRIVPVPMDGEGVEPEALREIAKRHQARLLACMPTLQNPTNRVMSETRRRAILNVASDLGMTVLEDDIYGFLAAAPTPPLAALAPEHAVYATSLSKCVAPGLRIGYVKAPHTLIPHLAGAQRAASIMAGSLCGEMAAHLIHSGQAASAAAHQREAARHRQALAASILPSSNTLGHDSSFHLWLQLPDGWSSAAFVRAAWMRGVAVTPGDAFTPDGADPSGVRICLCAVSEIETLRAALTTLSGLLRETPLAAIPTV
jgi:DNA-binding transcriptional MocR family regulator